MPEDSGKTSWCIVLWAAHSQLQPLGCWSTLELPEGRDGHQLSFQGHLLLPPASCADTLGRLAQRLKENGSFTHLLSTPGWGGGFPSVSIAWENCVLYTPMTSVIQCLKCNRYPHSFLKVTFFLWTEVFTNPMHTA